MVLTVLYYLCDPVHLPEAEQVFGAVAGELLFIWEVSSSFGVYFLFFCGMFITVDGLNKTGIPSALWDIMEPYSHVDRASGIAILAIVILVLSNLASNVPTGK